MKLIGVAPRHALVVVAAVAAAAGSLAACGGTEPPSPPAAGVFVRLSRDSAALGSPIDISYTFVVASGARFDEPLRVMLHVVDADSEQIWTDDHDPPTPTTEWRPGQTIEYTRTVFIPVYPYIGEATLLLGLYSPATGKRLALEGEDVGLHAYRVGRLQLLPQSETILTVFKDGWHPTEVAGRNASVEWQWTKKQATLAFRNPGRDAILYLELDNPGDAFRETQHVQVVVGAAVADQFDLSPGTPLLRKIPLQADQLGRGEMAELQIRVDKTFVPGGAGGSAGRDSRELGVRVFHAFVDPAR